jgi:invasion protein IalB
MKAHAGIMTSLAVAWTAGPAVAQAPRSNQWLVQCAGEGVPTCSVSMLIDAGRAVQNLLLLSIAVETGVITSYSPAREEVAALRVDDTPSVDMGVCHHGTCTLSADRAGDLLALMRRGGRLTLELKPYDGRSLKPFVVSLDGFGARYNEAQARQGGR